MVSVNDEEFSIGDLYAMQRANGDWFALDDHGRFRVPLFHTSHDAMMARLRNFGMLLFKPVAIDARLLKEIVPVGGAAEVDFWLVNDPLINLNRGRLLPHAEVALLVGDGVRRKTARGNATRDEIPRLRTPESNSNATAAWEDEGGGYAKCA